MQQDDNKDTTQNGFNEVLSKLFQACCQQQASEDNSIAPLLSDQDETLLQTLLQHDVHRCGMERASVLTIFCDKASRRKRLRRAVLGTQALTAEDTEAIAAASCAITLPSRLFATQLGLYHHQQQDDDMVHSEDHNHP